MRVSHGVVRSGHGPGVEIVLTGDEVATAIDAYLVTQGVTVRGPRTIREVQDRPRGQATPDMRVYVDPSGFVVSDGVKLSGRGGTES